MSDRADTIDGRPEPTATDDGYGASATDERAESTPTDDRTLISPGHAGRVVVGALVVSLYATWMAADLVGRWLLFPVVAVVAGYLLHQRDTSREQLVFVGYTLAGLLVVTPVVVVLPDAVAGFDVGATTMLFMTSNALLFVLFALLAAVVAAVTFRLDRGRGIVQHVRQTRAD